MGCDIHAHIEFKEDGGWQHFGEVTIARWYDLFGLLAGVRRDFEPVVLPRGMPEDMTWDTELDYQDYEGDAHHASWITVSEMKQVAAKDTDTVFDTAIATMDFLEQTGHPARFVFFFDN